MAFVTPFAPRPNLRRGPSALPKRPVRSAARRVACVSLAKSHPYGNGGVPTEIDWTGYDEDEMQAEIAEAERLFRQRSPPDDSLLIPWAIVMSADIIQWNNNLFEASRKEGFSWNLQGVNVVRMSEQTARRALPSDLTRLWTVRLEPDGLLTFSTGKPEDGSIPDRFLLVFEAYNEAVRFADRLVADGVSAAAADVPVVTLKTACREENLILGVVPQDTLVSPSQFVSNL